MDRKQEFFGLQMVCVVFAFCAAAAIASPAQSIFFTTLANFDGNNGAEPEDAVIQGHDGNFYGTTYGGGYLAGTVFKMSAAGTLTTLHGFVLRDGYGPYAGLVQATDGNFYGTTQYGGPNDLYSAGTIFKISPEGGLTTLYSFCDQNGCPNGCNPTAGLVQATDGNFYGTTEYGPASGCFQSPGSVFRITPSGKLTTMHAFNGSDGYSPIAGLVEATDGNFYGTTAWGGANDYGTVFKITPSGMLSTLYSFAGPDGANVFGGVNKASDGNFYGTTFSGGASDNGTVFRIT